jgi:hypothetical protein
MKVTVESYDTVMGVFWLVRNTETGEVIDDGFESTADAEMYCFDEQLDYGA